MRVFTLTIILFFFTCSLFAQVKIKIANIDKALAALYSLEGKKSAFIDSLPATNKNVFTFELNQKHSGFYRVLFNDNKHLDFVHDLEEIEIVTDANNLLDSLKII
ncbi:MAG TPA: DUF4369 domain-containing protein, partial [Ignavibacteriaceae bacterium]|nr:DUF4369 domain-containing protein [Ignavibacteriaceae bacterium]